MSIALLQAGCDLEREEAAQKQAQMVFGGCPRPGPKRTMGQVMRGTKPSTVAIPADVVNVGNRLCVDCQQCFCVSCINAK
eukprot:m.143028 g.143028  ORF g.143028 m.143028 type:complete len:80 (-) comp17153_c5_seq3:196-435(-)